MATWDWTSLRAVFYSVLDIEAAWPDGFRARTIGQCVVVEQASSGVVPWLVLRVPICGQHEMDLERALERNGTLAFSTIALNAGEYWFRVAVPFDSTELADPLRLLTLSLQAARLLSRVHVAPPSAVGSQFAHYAD